MAIFKITFTIIFLPFFICGCKSQPLELEMVTEYGIFKYSARDKKQVEDLLQTCQENFDQISDQLKLENDRNITIEIYPDQTEYDKYVMDPGFKGSPAISGNRRIQLVSPVSRIRIDTISYHNRLKFLIHEYIHILLDQLENEPPIWLDEGLACYFGSYDFYHSVVKSHFEELKFFPEIEQLANQYYEIPAADVFSFLAVEYLVASGQFDTIDKIIRNPNIIKISKPDWMDFVKSRYE